MGEVKRSITSAAGIVGVVAAILAGNAWRGSLERGSDHGSFTIDAILASKQKDPDVGVVDYFHEMSRLLKKEYVDPSAVVDQKLASGAVRGMVGMLGDPNSLYYDKDQFKIFAAARAGHFEGIGAQFALRMDSPPGKENRAGILPNPDEEDGGPAAAHSIKIPKLIVTAIVPGGPADKAGVKVGDVVTDVDGHWLVDAKTIQKLQDARVQFQAGKMSREAYSSLHREVRLRLDTSVLPLRAAQRLSAGTSGTTKITWLRGSESRETSIPKAVSAVPSFDVEGGNIKSLLFVPGSAQKLRELAATNSTLTIDLRNNVNGDFDEMRRCLAVVAPSGTYGYVLSQRDKKSGTVTVSEGNSKPPKLHLIVDSSTGGPAEMFALALQSKGLVQVSPTSMSPDKFIIEVFSLPDGSGYTLVKGKYSTTDEPAKHARLMKRPQPLVLAEDYSDRGDA